MATMATSPYLHTFYAFCQMINTDSLLGNLCQHTFVFIYLDTLYDQRHSIGL